jgi:hypothetical protein
LAMAMSGAVYGDSDVNFRLPSRVRQVTKREKLPRDPHIPAPRGNRKGSSAEIGDRGESPVRLRCSARSCRAYVCATKHFVGNASFFQWEHRADIRNQFSAVEQLCHLVQPPRSHIYIKGNGPNAITPLAFLGNSWYDRDERFPRDPGGLPPRQEKRCQGPPQEHTTFICLETTLYVSNRLL